VRRDPTPLVNAIFPIIGPVIRKAVAEALGRLVQSLNQTLDNSLSLRSLRWRLEARRSGRSFAEVVLAHTLIYRVEQVLLIHRHTGLLLLQVRAPHVQSEDAGMVSGMLTAIQDFARDSFHVPAGETVHTLQVGELTVWVETSPLLTLAAVIRGQAPGDFRDTLQTALENVHRAHAPELEAFDGDAAQFESARAHLEPCVRAQFAEPARRNSGSWLVIGLSAIVLLLAVWAFVVVRESRRWSGYLDRLKAEPGIVVIEARARGGKFYVTGLRDPLAADPAAFLSGFHLGADQVVSHWEPYHALGPPLVVKRAAQLLEPPASVTLRVQDGVLSAEGIAPAAWVETARQRAVLLPGIHRFDSTGLTDGAWARLSDGQREIEQTVVFFDEGVHLIPGQEAVLERLATRLISLGREAGQSGRRIRVSVLGHTDQTGTDEYNDRLSRQRADQVVSLLTAQGVPATGLAPRGVGSQHPWRAGGAEDLGPNRRVTFRVALDESAADTVTP
jgi:OOP family OmpA-OmpF porin